MTRRCRICRERDTRCWRCLRLMIRHRREAGLRKMPMDDLRERLYGGDIYKA